MNLATANSDTKMSQTVKQRRKISGIKQQKYLKDCLRMVRLCYSTKLFDFFDLANCCI